MSFADVVELYFQLHIAQEAAIRKYGGIDFTPGWSFDIIMRDLLTNKLYCADVFVSPTL